MFPIGSMTGGTVSVTVTVKEPFAWLPLLSVAVQLTVVVPSGKVDPDCGLHATVGLGSIASTAVGANATTAPDGPVRDALPGDREIGAGDRRNDERERAHDEESREAAADHSSPQCRLLSWMTRRGDILRFSDSAHY